MMTSETISRMRRLAAWRCVMEGTEWFETYGDEFIELFDRLDTAMKEGEPLPVYWRPNGTKVSRERMRNQRT